MRGSDLDTMEYRFIAYPLYQVVRVDAYTWKHERRYVGRHVRRVWQEFKKKYG